MPRSIYNTHSNVTKASLTVCVVHVHQTTHSSEFKVVTCFRVSFFVSLGHSAFVALFANYTKQPKMMKKKKKNLALAVCYAMAAGAHNRPARAHIFDSLLRPRMPSKRKE